MHGTTQNLHLTLLLLLTAATASANHQPEYAAAEADDFYVEAQVIDVRPLVRVAVEPLTYNAASRSRHGQA